MRPAQFKRADWQEYEKKIVKQESSKQCEDDDPPSRSSTTKNPRAKLCAQQTSYTAQITVSQFDGPPRKKMTQQTQEVSVPAISTVTDEKSELLNPQLAQPPIHPQIITSNIHPKPSNIKKTTIGHSSGLIAVLHQKPLQAYLPEQTYNSKKRNSPPNDRKKSRSPPEKKPKTSNVHPEVSPSVIQSSNPTPPSTSRPSQWVERYRPKKSTDIVGNSKNVGLFKTWVHERSMKRSTDSLVILLHGPPGIGKTSMAHAILREAGFQVYEVNASIVRTSKAVHQELVDVVPRVSLCGRTAVILDELDGGVDNEKSETDEDKSAVDGILEFLKWAKDSKKNTTNWGPIVCIANDVAGKAMQKLTHSVPTLRFFRPFASDLSKVLNNIIRAEKLQIMEKDKVRLIEASGGDVRRLVSLMESYALCRTADVTPSIKSFIESSSKDVFYDIFKSVIHIMYMPKTTWEQSINILQSDQSIMTLMIQENYIHVFEPKWPHANQKRSKIECEHKKPFSSCQYCKVQLQVVQDLAGLSETLSEVDCFESSVPMYKEDKEDARNACAGLLVSSIHYYRRKRHIGVENPKIVFTTFFSQRNKEKVSCSQQQFFREHMLSKSLLSTMDSMDYVECFKTMQNGTEWKTHCKDYGIQESNWESLSNKFIIS
jgi:hypothetical protein